MTGTRNDYANGAMEQVVADCFGALLAAIRRSEQRWRDHAVEALRDHDDARAGEYLVAVQRTAEAAGEVEALFNKRKDTWSAPPAITASAPRMPHPKGTGSRLRVHLNGKVLEYSSAAETFARTIAEIGVERVARLGKTLSGIPLIASSAAPDYQQQFALGEHHICTHSNTQTKKRLLDQIATELGIPLRVEITSEK
jgi:hypothetical protein